MAFREAWRIRTQAGKLQVCTPSSPLAPAPPVPWACIFGLRSKLPTGCWGGPLSSQANLSGFQQLDAPDSVPRAGEGKAGHRSLNPHVDALPRTGGSGGVWI